MTNLLDETTKQLQQRNYTPADVAWIGSRDGSYAMAWDEYTESVLNVRYYSGHTSPEIAVDLVIVLGDGSWLAREEYDGSEWWQYRQLPVRQPGARPFAKVLGDGWDDLKDLNDPRPDVDDYADDEDYDTALTS